MIELIYFALMLGVIFLAWAMFCCPQEDPAVGDKPVMILPKGTVVKVNGFPCELLRDTPFYSESWMELCTDTKAQTNE